MTDEKAIVRNLVDLAVVKGNAAEEYNEALKAAATDLRVKKAVLGKVVMAVFKSETGQAMQDGETLVDMLGRLSK